MRVSSLSSLSGAAQFSHSTLDGTQRVTLHTWAAASLKMNMMCGAERRECARWTWLVSRWRVVSRRGMYLHDSQFVQVHPSTSKRVERAQKTRQPDEAPRDESRRVRVRGEAPCWSILTAGGGVLRRAMGMCSRGLVRWPRVKLQHARQNQTHAFNREKTRKIRDPRAVVLVAQFVTVHQYSCSSKRSSWKKSKQWSSRDSNAEHVAIGEDCASISVRTRRRQLSMRATAAHSLQSD